MEAAWGGGGQDGGEGGWTSDARAAALRAPTPSSRSRRDEGFSPDRAHLARDEPRDEDALARVERHVEGLLRARRRRDFPAVHRGGKREVVVPRGAKDARRKMRGRSVGGARSRRGGAGRDFARQSRFRFPRGAATVRCPDERFRENASTSDARFAPLRASQRSARRHDAMLANLGKRSRSGRAKGPRGPLCQHGKADRGYFCKECPGKGICEHRRVRRQCKECGGSGICEHRRQRHHCKECGGASICVHERKRSRCKECGGSEICDHGRRRSQCKECGGSGICEHGRRRSRYKACARLSRIRARDAKAPIEAKVEIKQEFDDVEDPGEEDYSLQ